MIINNLNQADENHVLNGNAEDVCVLCAYEMAKNEGKTLSQADRLLRGQFEGVKMLSVPLNGLRVTICMNHIHKVADANPVTDEEEEA